MASAYACTVRTTSADSDWENLPDLNSAPCSPHCGVVVCCDDV